MGKDIEDIVSKCQTCLKYRNQQSKETLMPHQVPEFPWQKVGSDIMHYKGKDYLIVVDFYSKYPELVQLESKTATTIITKMKSIFARHGIPEQLMSDNMPYSSQEFREFGKQWGIKLITSSPLFAQSNGQAERFVQTLKKLLKKAEDEEKDHHLALLEYRNTPLAGMKYSPSQMLMSRTLRTKIPTAMKVLIPNVVNPREELIQRQEKQKEQYDKIQRAKDLPPLDPGDVVRVRKGNVWEPAIVTQDNEHPRSYVVNRDGREIRRNRSDLLRTNEDPPSPTKENLFDDLTPPPPVALTPPVQPTTPARPKLAMKAATPKIHPSPPTTSKASDKKVTMTSSGRISRLPERFGNFVTY